MNRPMAGPESVRSRRGTTVRGRVSAVVSTFALALATRAGDGPDWHAASLEELLRHAQRDGTTEAKRSAKRAARAELVRRGPETFAYLMDLIHTENATVHVLAFDMAKHLPAAQSVPMLLRNIGSERGQTRKIAAYFLGFLDASAHAGSVLPLLDDDETAGAAARTLGKWKVERAVPRILPLLWHEDERRRVVAANALGDIGDPRAVPHLLDALDDPVFTVRKAASRALAALGAASEAGALTRLAKASVPAPREIVLLLGQLRSRAALRPLRLLLRHGDPFVRADAARALHAVDPRRAGPWCRAARVDVSPLGLRVDEAGGATVRTD